MTFIEGCPVKWSTVLVRDTPPTMSRLFFRSTEGPARVTNIRPTGEVGIIRNIRVDIDPLDPSRNLTVYDRRFWNESVLVFSLGPGTPIWLFMLGSILERGIVNEEGWKITPGGMFDVELFSSGAEDMGLPTDPALYTPVQIRVTINHPYPDKRS